VFLLVFLDRAKIQSHKV